MKFDHLAEMIAVKKPNILNINYIDRKTFIPPQVE